MERKQQKCRYLIYIGTFYVFLQACQYIAYAAPLPKATDNQPVIISIEAGGNYVWFAGIYFGGLVLRFDPQSETWKSFYYPFHEVRKIIQNEEDIQFFGHENNIIKFDKSSSMWSEEKLPKPTEIGMRKYGIRYLSESTFDLDQRSFEVGNVRYLFRNSFIYKIEGERITRIFELPQLTTAMLLRYRPDVQENFGYDESKYEFSDVVASIDNHIGPLKKIGDNIWFGLSFYEGEGWEGVGGLGFFDLKKETVGILRLTPLKDCSVSHMRTDDDWLWLTTERAGEGAAYGCTGLIKFNTKDGGYLAYEPPFQPSGKKDILLYSSYKSGDDVWMATPYGITRYNGAKNIWWHYAITEVQVKEGAKALSGINFFGQKNSNVSYTTNNIPSGQYGLTWVEYDNRIPYFEIDSPFKAIGWLKKEDYQKLQALPKRGEYWEEASDITANLYSEPSESSMIIGFLVVARMEKLEEKDGWIKIEAHAKWINGKDIIPQISLVKKGNNLIIRRVLGNRTDVKVEMVQNVRKERLQRDKALQDAKLVLNKTCLVGPGNLDCDIMLKGYFEDFFGVKIIGNPNLVSRYKPVDGAKDGIFSVYMDINSLTLSSAEGDNFSFAPYGAISKGQSIDIPPKGKVYKFENHKYRLLIALEDYKISPVTLSDGRTGNVFEWVKFHIKAYKITEKMESLKKKYHQGNLHSNKWILQSLDARLDNAKKDIEKGNTRSAKNTLKAFINEVEAQGCESYENCTSGKHLTSEAYGLLKYNAQYLVDRL